MEQTYNSLIDLKETFATPEQVLKKVFGYDSFRPLQKEIIDKVLLKKDVIAIMPTGGGKSLCYQIPALINSGLTIVVSPLIALMQDQVSALQATGIPAVFLSSSLDTDIYLQTVQEIKKGKIKLLYLSPEALSRKEKILYLLENIKVECITIDEAHCISEWGHDFRPDYRNLAEVRDLFPNASCLALTATATDRVRADIQKNLKLKNPTLFLGSFNRPNIFLEVKQKKHGVSQVRDCLDLHQEESGIIYCFSRKQVDDLSNKLQDLGYKTLPYHAGLSDEIRAKNQQLFIRDKVKIMVATVAFGMGINKPNVRFVIHYDMPKSLEQYYQEIGRAGRDGEAAHALLLYSEGDLRKVRFFMNEMDVQEKQRAENLLQGMIKYASSYRCRRKVLLSYFGENTNSLLQEKSEKESLSKENCCDICSAKPIKQKDVTIPTQKILSCILRTGQRFGTTYVVDVLLGSKQQKIISNNHHSLTTWGIGKDISKDDWYELVACLIEYGYLVKSTEYNVLSITEYARNALQNRSKIMLPLDISFKSEKTPKKSKIQKFLLQKNYTPKDINEEEILKALKEWRKKTAEEEDVPPYIIFSDKTLYALVKEKPCSHSQLLNIHGIGTVKAERFGNKILRIINTEI